MKNCERAMESYLSLDKGEPIPPRAAIHFFLCKRCRSEVRFLRKAEGACAKKDEPLAMLNDDAILAVMKKIALAKGKSAPPLPLFLWILGGLAALALLLAFSVFTKKSGQSPLKAFAYAELAAFVSAYCAFFIQSNMEFFVKLASSKMPKPSSQAG